MSIKVVRHLLCASLFIFFSHGSNAAIVSIDWQTAGDSLITRDTTSGLDWLDLTETNDMSRDYVLTQLGSGGLFDGWRYATTLEVITVWSNFGVDLTVGSGDGGQDWISYWLDYNVKDASLMLGNISCEYDCNISPYGTTGVAGESDLVIGASWDMGVLEPSTIYLFDHEFPWYYNTALPRVDIGHYLVMESVVPVPAAVWLFGSGLISLVGLARRKKA